MDYFVLNRELSILLWKLSIPIDVWYLLQKGGLLSLLDFFEKGIILCKNEICKSKNL